VIAYDVWAAYDHSKKRYFLGDTLNGYICDFDGVDIPPDIKSAREEAISFASYRFIQNRYFNSPDFGQTYILISDYMNLLGYDVSITSTDYVNGGAAELGNYIAQQIQLYGYTDGSNEQNEYANQFYDSINPPIEMDLPGNPDIIDPNHWQAITLIEAYDQSNNPILGTPEHLSPEWGEVHPFSLDTTMYNELSRDGDTYKVYFDSLYPAFLDQSDSSAWDSFYKWNHTLVSIWQSHLDPADGVMWDISPASIGNNTWYPSDSTQYAAFYDLTNGGDPGTGYALNPVTNLPYPTQVVPRGDYARVLAEFWADGLDSETPPGHWFEIYHYVSDQPTFERKWKGIGPVLDTLEYDLKAHLTLGGTMHDAAISAWSLKGYYDYIRPVSSIRYMADQGQSSDTTELNYHPNGIPLLVGYVEVVQLGDPLAGTGNQNVGKIKLFTWRGPDYIIDPLVDMAGVGWILAENWWPYQRPTFVTPPFAGFVSGHSTFSRAAANTMEFMTGSPYFPGGLGEFEAIQNSYLVFEEGPSTTIKLQWASYKDAADQCSLSRLWGGIHPPIDDIPGRIMGEHIGALAFNKADSIFETEFDALISASITDSLITISDIGGQFDMNFEFNVPMDTSVSPSITLLTPNLTTAVNLNQIVWIDSFNVVATFDVLNSSIEIDSTRLKLDNLFTGSANQLTEYTFNDYFIVDTKKPVLSMISPATTVVNDSLAGLLFGLEILFDEPCDISSIPPVNFSSLGLVNPTFTGVSANWLNDSIFAIDFFVLDYDETVLDILTDVAGVYDTHGNPMDASSVAGLFILDTENPSVLSTVSSDAIINLLSTQFTVNVNFNEAMDTTGIPTAEFWDQGMVFPSLSQNTALSSWLDSSNLELNFSVLPETNNLLALDFFISEAFDSRGNLQVSSISTGLIWHDMKSPSIASITANKPIVSDSLVGLNNYYIDIEFDEDMDTLIQPLASHSAAQIVSNSIQNNLPESYFIDSTHYRAYYEVLDENIEIDPVYFGVELAADFAGNPQVSFIDSNFISIDTKNPSVTGVYASDYTLDQNGQFFDILIMYDESMYHTIDPIVSFTPLLLPPLNLSLLSESWITSESYELNYQLLNFPSQSTIYDFSIDSGRDLAGNQQLSTYLDEFVEINPALGIIEIENESVVIYPSILYSGQSLSLRSESTLLDKDLTFDLFNGFGQAIQQVKFEKANGHFVSNEILAISGIYYLKNATHSLKIIVL
jgi:hypothetical protein